ncbi:Tol-Pal system beta propeller repeat protein TolB [Candidatus Odyssella acanthamoebae]|uniref:Tol-Pal system beta propeller repeat protein TolB n=1 Tax=Candidatus Odyssella acanthamoebae TaxID=91604 RepID=UPI000A42E49C|nr:Tol-Pal system beta propeller repeat protein TolB [Candidatus Paracaedibacter acanthamoebae]
MMESKVLMMKNINQTLKHVAAASFAIVFSYLGISSAQAELEVTINQGQIKPTPIAITPFVDKSGQTFGQDLAAIITYDLQSSGLFLPIDPQAFVQNIDSLNIQGPRFADWRIINAQCLLAGEVEVSGGQVTVRFRLFDSFRGTQMLGLELSVDEKKWRRLGHMVADEVYKRITGEEGYFNTMISFIEESGPHGRKRMRRLGIMDYDGANVRYLTDGKHMAMTPRFSPNNRDIAFLSFEKSGLAQVYLYNLANGSKKLLGQFEGMSFAPRFSPDATKLVMSLEKAGNSAVYLKDLNSGSLTALTQHTCIDTSPCFSPDGNNIVFTSDRGGNEQIYVMDNHGGDVRRISFGGGKYSQPVWSPRGDLITFTKIQQGQFYIGVMNPDGSNERLICTDYLVEAPIWSPNGRVILYTRERRAKGTRFSKICAIDVTGRTKCELKTPREATDAAWSQLLDKSVTPSRDNLNLLSKL